MSDQSENRTSQHQQYTENVRCLTVISCSVHMATMHVYYLHVHC